MNQAVKEILERFGRLDVLVNNAGTHVPGDVIDTTDEVYDRVMDSIMWGTFYFSPEPSLPSMRSRPVRAIVNVSSVWAWDCAPAQRRMCRKGRGRRADKEPAPEVAKHGIRVNAVGPYLIATELHRAG